jgi:hypothetical protein
MLKGKRSSEEPVGSGGASPSASSGNLNEFIFCTCIRQQITVLVTLVKLFLHLAPIFLSQSIEKEESQSLQNGSENYEIILQLISESDTKQENMRNEIAGLSD